METCIGSSDLNLENIITESVERLVSIRLAIFNTSNTHGRTCLPEDTRKVLSVDISGLCVEGSQLLLRAILAPAPGIIEMATDSWLIRRQVIWVTYRVLSAADVLPDQGKLLCCGTNNPAAFTH